MSGFRTKPGLFNKHTTLPDCGLWRGSRPELFSNNNSSTSISSVPPALQPGQGSLLSPLVNREVMKQHLALIAARTKPGRHAVVIMDGAGWHTMECADDFNLSLIKLPPYSPELQSYLNRYGAGFVSMCWLIAASRDYDDILMPAHRPGSTFIADVEWGDVTL